MMSTKRKMYHTCIYLTTFIPCDTTWLCTSTDLLMVYW